MALKKESIENFFNISQQHANVQKSIKNKTHLDDHFITGESKETLVKKEDIIINQLSTQNQHESHTNPAQTQHKPNTNPAQTQHKPNTKLYTKPYTSVDKKRSQTLHKHTQDEQINLQTLPLYGNLKKLMDYICNQCKFKGTHEIIVSIRDISTNTRIVIGSINTTLIRLESKGFIKRIANQGGRGGWKKIRVNALKYQEMLYMETIHKPSTNHAQTQHKHCTESNTLPYTIAPSSSNFIKTTTTGLTPISNEWLSIDVEPLASIGFSKNHLSQIYSQNKLSSAIVQDSIYAFAFDLQENNKMKVINGDPINFLMGILRKGKPYTPPSNYESPQDKAMRIYHERMKQKEDKRQVIEKESRDLAYTEWFSKLEDKEKRQFLPQNLRRNARVENNKMLDGSARNYFKDEVWPIKKKEIVQESNIIEQGEVKER